MATIDVKNAAGATEAVEKPNANGRAASAASRPVTWATEDLASIGSLTETAPASDTASSGLNGRLQRIAQRITSLIALFPTSLGAKAASASLAVTQSTEDAARIGATSETVAASDTATAGLNGLIKRVLAHLTSLIGLVATESTLGDALTELTAIKNAGNSTSTVNVAQDTAVIKSGAADLTPKFASISSTGSGDTLALVSGKKIRVLAMFFVVAGATTVKFQSGATTDKTGAMSFAANGGISLPFNPTGWFETVSGEKLNHVLGSSVGIAGGFLYVEV